MTSRAERLQPVVDLAVKREKEAAAHMAELRGQLVAAEQQLADLRTYREDYGVIPTGSNVAGLVNRQQFLQRIDTAIVHQMSEVVRRQHMLVVAQDKWMEARGRAKALDSVTTRYREDERKAEERRDQAQADERSQYRRVNRPAS
jgi:flagellar protein FliJ